MSYYDLSMPVRCLVILGLFLMLCIGGCILPSLFRRKKTSHAVVALLAMLCSGILMIIYTAEARANLRSLALPAVSAWLCRQPLLLPMAVILAALVFYLVLITDEWRYRKNTITRSSIKEGIDKISSGLCFYQKGGRVILANRRMNDLCFQIVGRDLQNAEIFWKVLRGGEVQPGVQRIQAGIQPIFRLTDGTVWTFSYEELDGICQLSAADTTRIQAITEELKQKNTELEALNIRLRKYGENVDELTRSRERLETKSRIHSELGQALLSSRRYLVSEEETQDVPLALWRGNIAMLRMEAEHNHNEKPMEMLERVAAATGITIQITGAFPDNEEIQKLFVQAAAEALTNAISHAQARTLYIDLNEDARNYSVRFRNDGRLPADEITEGGGLGSLRKKIESEGGTMCLNRSPEFSLSITVPKKRREIL